MPDPADFCFIKKNKKPYIFERKAECAGKDKSVRAILRPRVKSPKQEGKANV